MKAPIYESDIMTIKTSPSDVKSLLLLPGDGIGPEVMAEVEALIPWVEEQAGVRFELTSDLVGGACYDAHRVAVKDETIAAAKAADAVLFGAVGGPQYDTVPRAQRPEAGLLRLRKELDLFANLRPAIAFDALTNASSLKQEVIAGLDILFVRELTAGVYFGQPRGMQTFEGPEGSQERCIDTQSYTRAEIERVADAAFSLAQKRSSRLHSVEKANVMETGAFWREVVSEYQQKAGYSDIELAHMYADNCAMQLVRWPKQFDVIVTDNLFGDLLSDCAAMLTGSLGMLPSASLGAADAAGKRHALYEPVHGSAPDIAGKGLANPSAMILSFAMCLRYSFDLHNVADKIEQAIQSALAKGARTADIKEEGTRSLSTREMGAAIAAEL